MKKIIILALVSFIGTTIYAQANYDTCSQIKQFEGEWRYVNGSDTIRIFLRHARVLNDANNTVNDFLFGWHEYKQGNTVISSDYANRNMTILYVDTINTSSSIKLGINFRNCTSSNRTVMGSILDVLQGNEGKMVTAKRNSSNTILTWKQDHASGYGVFSGFKGMTLPKEFQLTKQ